MVIHSYFYGWKGDKLLDLLDLKSSEERVHRDAIQIMQVEGSVEYAKEKAALIMRRAWKELDPVLPDGEAKEDIKDLY
jgi:geranylgeranyl pyrophosphate synthase